MIKRDFLKLLVYDLKQGFRYNRWKYGVLVVGILVVLWMFYAMIRLAHEYGGITDTVTITDLLVYLFRGMEVYIPDNDDQYALPVVWLLLQTLSFYITAYYPQEDIYRFGQQIFLRSRKKTWWWYSKVIWCLASVALFYLVVFLTTAVACLFMGGEFSFDFSPRIAAYCYGGNLFEATSGTLWLQLLLMPFSVSASMCLLQLMLGFFITPILSFFCVMTVMVASTYVVSPYLIGNYSMLQRCAPTAADGVDVRIGLAMAAGIAVLALVIGAWRILRYDILTKN